MMGERRVDQGALFYEFSLERHVGIEEDELNIAKNVSLDASGAGRAFCYDEMMLM